MLVSVIYWSVAPQAFILGSLFSSIIIQNLFGAISLYKMQQPDSPQM